MHGPQNGPLAAVQAASASAESTVPNSVTMLIKKAAPGAGWTFSDSSGSGPDSNRSNGRRPGSGGRAAPGLAKTLDSRAPLSNVCPCRHEVLLRPTLCHLCLLPVFFSRGIGLCLASSIDQKDSLKRHSSTTGLPFL